MAKLALSKLIRSRDELKAQYADPANLNARQAIYRFARDAGTPWMRWLLDQMNLPADARVLEIGCGDGQLWLQNRDRLAVGWRVVLGDMSSGMIGKARGNLRGDQFQYTQLDAELLPFVDGHFDAVIANHVLYHVNDRPRAFAEIRRVLRPGGRLFAATNSDDHLGHMKELIARFLDASEAAADAPFSLETGGAQLSMSFKSIDVRRVSGELHIDDPEVVAGYVMSIEHAPQRITGERLAELHRVVREEIDRKGAFVVATAAGLFIARA